MTNFLTGFDPIANENSKILILGSMPSVESLKKGQYYAHPQNRFWRIMFDYFGEPFSTDYEKRVELLLKNGIALWDSVERCERVGSLDSAIKNEQATDVVGLLKRYKGIKGIFTNGKKSAEVFEKYNRLSYVCLPSTSPANAVYSYEKLFLAWKEQLDKFFI